MRSLLAVLAIAAAPLAAQQRDVDSSVVVAPGVVHRHLIVGAAPWSVHVLAIDLRHPGISVRAAHAADHLRGLERVSSMAARHNSDTARVIAAVNADFFDLKTGENENNQVVEGQPWKAVQVTESVQDSGHHVHSQFAMTRTGHPLIEQFVFTDRYRPDRGPLRTLVGGWPRLVVHGVSIADSVDALEGTVPSFSVTRHPRTGVGFSRDSSTLYLITVDGRQESSSGMSLAEFANIMLSVGVYEGLNLDGGGSTTMVIGGVVVNHPSDTAGERPVGNALLIVQSHPHE